jgi:hypothetical protein
MPDDNLQELDLLLERLCDGLLDRDGGRRLLQLLDESEVCRSRYLETLELHAALWTAGSRTIATPVLPSSASSSPLSPSPSPLVSFPSLSGNVLQGWPLAYLVATVVLGIGLLIGAITHVSQPERIVRQHLPSIFGRGAGGDGNLLPSPSGRGAGGEGNLLPSPSGRGAGGEGNLLPSPSGRGAGGEGSVADAARPPVVGQITGMADCQWMEGPKSEIRNLKSPIHLGDRVALRSGLLEITYNTGPNVILQGPATYTVESPAGGFLSVGKLTARVEKKVASGQWLVASKSEISNTQSPIPNPSSLSTIHYPLFTIKTPTATVTDLGTEFGVEVVRSGETTSHVFRGSIRVQRASADGKVEANGRILGENETVRVEGSPDYRQIVALRAFAPSHFVREIPKRRLKVLDLVDVVAGGNGFSGRRGHGIDVTNGRPSDRQPPSPCFALRGDGKYHRAEGLLYVDGVFVPDGQTGRVRVDSAGHVFDGFPLSPPETAFNVWAGGPIPTNDHFRAGNVSFPTELDGVDYASPGHGLLFMYASKGITFDLDAIRRANPGCTLSQFRAVAANMVTVRSAKSEGYWCADIWVFVDGQARFQRRRINRSNGVYSIMIPLGRNDRFLTLAATDGGDGNDWDLVLFGDPRLELSAMADPVQMPVER